MILIIAVLCLFPGLALAFQGRGGFKPAEVVRVLLLFTLSLAVASPFLTNRGMGHGDALNYSNSVADIMTQLHAGVLPVAVGQSEYAFNGPVHPLRTACYFDYATGLLGLLLGSRLTFWGLQNLLLAASLTGAAYSAYFCLRKLGTVGPWIALALAAAYLLAPGLLAAAHSFDLYMTVTTAPYLPVAMLGLIRVFHDRTWANVSLFAIGLAVCWLAHPPVALWLSAGSVVVLATGLIVHPPRWRDFAVIPAGLLLLALLCGYGFVSSLTIDPNFTSRGYERALPVVASTVATMTRQAWPGSLRPVSRETMDLGDFQLGYTLWLLLGAAVVAAARLRRNAAAWSLLGMIFLYIVVTVPVPWLHHTLWLYLPLQFVTMTNMWPMQRMYLLLAAAVVFLGAVVQPGFYPRSRRRQWITGVIVFAALAWSGCQAWPFLRHNRALQYSAERTAATHRLENVDVGISSYAFLGFPSWFSNGPMDPEYGLRLLNRADLSVLVSNDPAGRKQPAAATGRLRIVRTEANLSSLEPQLTIEPGRRYRLRFHFLTPAIHALLYLRGPTTWREQTLPSYVGPKGFGMEQGNSPEIGLHTSSTRPEQVTLTLNNLDNAHWDWSDFADFTLEEVDRGALPLQLIRLVPELECRFDAPQDCWLETPRMYLKGYAAWVDGHPAQVERSQESEIMVAVPAGKHTLELKYIPPPLLRDSFWAAVCGWIAVVGFFVTLPIRRSSRRGRESPSTSRDAGPPAPGR